MVSSLSRLGLIVIAILAIGCTSVYSVCYPGKDADGDSVLVCIGLSKSDLEKAMKGVHHEGQGQEERR